MKSSLPDRLSTMISQTRLDRAGKSLVPAATSNALDPLKWLLLQKYTIVGIVSFFYFLLTYLTRVSAPLRAQELGPKARA
jgi:hypothetical protein